MSAPHTCHARGCNRACPPRLLMCPPCWSTVPPALSPLIYEAMRRGKAARNHPNGAWMLAADACITAAAWAVGRPVPPMWLARAMEYARAQDGDEAAELAAEQTALASPPALAAVLRRLWLPAPGTAAAQAVAAGRRARLALEIRWEAVRASGPARSGEDIDAALEQWERAEAAYLALAWALPGAGENLLAPP